MQLWSMPARTFIVTCMQPLSSSTLTNVGFTPCRNPHSYHASWRAVTMWADKLHTDNSVASLENRSVQSQKLCVASLGQVCADHNDNHIMQTALDVVLSYESFA